MISSYLFVSFQLKMDVITLINDSFHGFFLIGIGFQSVGFRYFSVFARWIFKTSFFGYFDEREI